MYKILIVEDEKDAGEGLAELIRQYDSSIEVTVRRDGLEGYQTAIEMQPDVIISDIRMPGCDGLTMASRLQGRRFQGKILLLTGYADFRYARQAVRYGITEYILKPIVPDEFLPLLQRYLRETEREKLRNERKNPRVSYLFSDADDEALGEQISYMQYTECFFAILYISGDSHLPIQMKEMLLKEKDLYMAYLPDKQYRGICIGFRDHAVNHIAIAKLNALLKDYENVVCVYTIQNIQTVPSVKAVWDRLQEAVIWSITYDSRFINYTPAMERTGESEQEDEYIHSSLQKLQYQYSHGEYKELLLRYMEEMRRKHAHPRSIRMTAVSGLVKKGSQRRYFVAVEKLSQAKTFAEITACIQEYFQEDPDSGLEQYSRIVQQAISEMNEHYTDQISLNSVAEKLKITPQYLSKIFMKETSTTFVNYLTSLRMEKAKLLLRNTSQKINLICQQVGYPDAKYFCTLFKKEVGVTPNQYRSNQI